MAYKKNTRSTFKLGLGYRLPSLHLFAGQGSTSFKKPNRKHGPSEFRRYLPCPTNKFRFRRPQTEFYTAHSNSLYSEFRSSRRSLYPFKHRNHLPTSFYSLCEFTTTALLESIMSSF